MKVILADPAKEELENGKTYYELEQKGLGEIFEEEVKIGIKLITKYPYSWPEMREGIKKFILHKFPYKIIYSIEKDIILVLAIAHQHQKPDYWVDRIQDKKE